MTPQSLQCTTPTDTTIVLTRAFQAPRHLVWAAMTEPDKMRRWMLPPPGFTMSACEVLLRVGGALRVAWKSDEADPAMILHGVWTEVDAPARMAHTETMMLGTGQVIGTQLEVHELSEKDGGTWLRITQTYASKEARDGALASGMDEGMEACYQHLDGLLAR
jgi:uncharacterized protein YndB with AHSA1/START domain